MRFVLLLLFHKSGKLVIFHDHLFLLLQIIFDRQFQNVFLLVLQQCGKDYVIISGRRKSFIVSVLFSSVGVHRCDSFIWVQRGPRKTRQTIIKPQKSRCRLDRQTDRQKYYTATQGIWTLVNWQHALFAMKSCADERLLPIKSRFLQTNILR